MSPKGQVVRSATKKPTDADKIYGWPVKSQRDLGDGLSAVYTVLLWSSGEMTCDCPGWIFKRGKPGFDGCKHIRKATEEAEKIMKLHKAGQPLPAASDEEGKPSSGALPQVVAGIQVKEKGSHIKFGRTLYLGE